MLVSIACNASSKYWLAIGVAESTEILNDEMGRGNSDCALAVMSLISAIPMSIAVL